MSTILKAPLVPYPLATKSQEVVPHEVVAPAGCYKIVVQAGASYVLENLPDFPILAIVCETHIFAIFSDDTVAPSLALNTLIGGAMICTPGITTIANPGKPNLVLTNESSAATTIYVQLLHTWNILGTTQQTTRI